MPVGWLYYQWNEPNERRAADEVRGREPRSKRRKQEKRRRAARARNR